MKLSTKVTYALRAVLALAQGYGKEQLTVSQLASGNNIPKSYLEQILNTLRHADIVKAVRGPKGGYTLARSPQDVSVGDIVRAVEGELQPIMCCFPESKSEDCRQSKDCLSQTLCAEMESHFQRILNGTSLQNIIDNRGEALSESAGDTPCAAPTPTMPTPSALGTTRKS